MISSFLSINSTHTLSLSLSDTPFVGYCYCIDRLFGGERGAGGLAELSAVSVRLGGCGGGSWYRRRKRSRTRSKVIKEKFMDFWHKMVFPVRRVWFAVSARVKSRKNGGGLLKLHDDVETCGYQDVKVMWEMLRRSESEQTGQQTKRKQRPFWRVLVWSNHSAAASSSFPEKHG